METKLKFLVSGVVICLLMAICPSVTAEKISDEAEWVLVWQEDEVKEVTHGEPTIAWVALVYWAWTAYDIYSCAKAGDYGCAVFSATPAGKFKKFKNFFGKTKIHRHHLLPNEFRDYFERAGINIDECLMELDEELHTKRPKGIHTTKGGDWNGRWRKFIADNPKPERKEILKYMMDLVRDFRLDENKVPDACKP